MDEITEYSNLCDLVYSVSRLNITNNHICNTHEEAQKYLEDNKEQIKKQQLQEMDNPFILHFQEEYTDLDKLLTSFDLREYVIPYSNYLTNIVNNYLMEVMMQYMNIGANEKSNIKYLIKYYHFSVDYVVYYYSYQKELEKLSSFPDERSKLKAKAKLDMNW